MKKLNIGTVALALAAVLFIVGVSGTMVVSATNSSDEVPADHPAYQEIQTLYNLGWVDDNAGQLAMSRILTRYEMALITLNAVDKIVFGSPESPPPVVLEIVGNLVAEFESEINLFGSDFAFDFKRFATRIPQQPAQDFAMVDEQITLPPIGSISGTTTPSPGYIGDENGLVLNDGYDGFEQFPTGIDEVYPVETAQVYTPSTDVSSDEMILISRAELEELIENKLSEKIDTTSSQSASSSPSSFEVHGGTSIYFRDRNVVGIPLDEDGKPLKDEDGKVLQTEHTLSQNLWFDITGRPNENVTITTRIQAENPTGFITDFTNLQLDAVRAVAETERLRLTLGTLENVKYSNYTLATNDESRVDGVQATYSGDKFKIDTLAGRRRESPVDVQGDPTGIFPSYIAGLQIVTDALIKGLRLSGSLATQWDDAKWADHVPNQAPARFVTGGIAIDGNVLTVDVSGELAVQAFDPDTTTYGESISNLATYINLGKVFGETEVNVNARYISENHQIAGSNDLDDLGENVWVPGEKGFGLTISRPFANRDGNVSFGLDTGTRYIRPDEEEEKEGYYESGLLTSLAINYGLPITYEENQIGSFGISNITSWQDTKLVEDEAIFTREGLNKTSIDISLTPIDNWNHNASTSFTYGIGIETDENSVNVIDQKELRLSYGTDYTWNPVERLQIKPSYQFEYAQDFGNIALHSQRHNVNVSANYELVPTQLNINGLASIKLDRVYQTELDEDGEPVEGRSANTQLYRVGTTYTPSWFAGLSLSGHAGKRTVNYVLNDEEILDENAWIFGTGIGYSGRLGDRGNWYANYGIEWNLDEHDIYDNTTVQTNVGAKYQVTDIISIDGSYGTTSDKSSTSKRGSLSASIDLGPNTSFGVMWTTQELNSHVDDEDDAMFNEIVAQFSGRF